MAEAGKGLTRRGLVLGAAAAPAVMGGAARGAGMIQVWVHRDTWAQLVALAHTLRLHG
jgi:hypothetical protein